MFQKDALNPGWQMGWLVLRIEPLTLESAWTTEQDAKEKVEQLGPDFIYCKGNWEIGTDNFITSDLRFVTVEENPK